MSHKHHHYNNNWKRNNDNVEETKPVEITQVEVLGIVEESEPEVKVETPPVVIRGTVTACTKLNVRKTPKTGADVVCVIDVNSEVVIDKERSTVEFYRVTTASGREGFCMKKFISIQQ